MTVLAYFNVGWFVIQMKALTLGDGSNWKQKLKIGKVWTRSEMYLKALTCKKELKGYTSMKKVTLHSHLSGQFSIFGRERRKKMMKNLQRSLSNKICRKKNFKQYHKRLRFSVGWPVYHKNKWVWCIKGSDKKDPATKTGELMLV